MYKLKEECSLTEQVRIVFMGNQNEEHDNPAHTERSARKYLVPKELTAKAELNIGICTFSLVNIDDTNQCRSKH